MVQKIEGKSYVLTDNGLLKIVVQNQRALIIIPETIAYEIVDYIHQQSTHSGIRRMLVCIRNSDIYIPNKTKLLSEISRKCVFCQSIRKTGQEEILNLLRPATKPFQHVYIDVMSLEGYNNNNYKFLLSMIDLFSGYADGRIMSNKTSERIAKNLIFLAHRHSLSQESTITMDNGKEFQNHLVKSALSKLNIYITHILPYNSRANRVERFHKSLRHILKTQNTTSKDLSMKVEMAIMTHNQLPSERHNMMTPFEVVYGRAPKGPLEYLTDKKQIELDGNQDYGHQNFEWCDFISQQHLIIARQLLERHQNTINPNHEGKVFDIGQIVLVYDPIINLSKIKGSKSEGPYKILSKNFTSYVLGHMFTGARKIRNHRFVREFRITDKLKEALDSNYIAISNDNTINVLNDDNIEREMLMPEIDEEIGILPVEPRYNLRSRVAKN